MSKSKKAMTKNGESYTSILIHLEDTVAKKMSVIATRSDRPRKPHIEHLCKEIVRSYEEEHGLIDV